MHAGSQFPFGFLPTLLPLADEVIERGGDNWARLSARRRWMADCGAPQCGQGQCG